MAAAMTYGLAACGSKAPEGKYFTLDSTNFENYNDFADDIDDAIKDYADENSDFYSIDFDGDEAEILYSESISNGESIYYAGYSIDDKTNQFNFEYQSVERKGRDETLEYEISDKLDEDDLVGKSLVELLKELDASGGMPAFSTPWTSRADKLTDYAVLPRFTRVYYGERPTEDVPAVLYYMGDVICTDLYGVELDDKYKSGKKFTLNFDQYDAFADCPIKKNLPEYFEESLALAYHCDKTDSTIEFEDGEWSWYNHEGDLLNDGEYVESDDYEGLIGMYITDKSERNTGSDMFCDMPIFLYFADDGNVYYPAFVKEK